MSKIYLYSFIVALAGFLFGFDTVVISGAEKQLQDLWQTSEFFHGTFVVGMALWGTVIGAIFGGFPTDKLGRKNTLILIGALYLASAVGSALVSDPYSFAFFRFIGGLGVGASTITAPGYISEIAPPKKRGFLGGLYQLSLVFGILIAYMSNAYFTDYGENAWRYMVGAEAIPALIYALLIFTVPKSPRWLLSKGKIAQAKNILDKLGIEKETARKMVEEFNTEKETNTKENIFSNKYRKPLILAFFIAFFNQFSGINAFLYFAPRIFEGAGLGDETAALSSIGIGATNLLFTIVGILLVDKLGRKQLMYIGSFGYIISLVMVAIAFFAEWQGMMIPGFLFLFIASHAIGQGTVIWVFIAELFPNHLRASGQSFGCSVHWVLAAIIPSLTPVFISNFGGGYLFAFFAVMMMFQLIWVHFKMPETKGISLEELSKKLSN